MGKTAGGSRLGTALQGSRGRNFRVQLGPDNALGPGRNAYVNVRGQRLAGIARSGGLFVGAGATRGGGTRAGNIRGGVFRPSQSFLRGARRR